MNAVNVYVLNDDRGGFTCVFRDTFSEAHRTQKFDKDSQAKFQMLRWLKDTFGTYPRVTWHSRSEADYNACHPKPIESVEQHNAHPNGRWT